MRFLDDREVTACLQEIFEWPLDNTIDGRVCPIVLLGHALDNDVEKMQKLLDFDPLAKGNLVKQIDTQVIARDVGHWNHPVNQIGLQRLVMEMGFAYRDSHTASNDAAMTLIAAMQLVLDAEFKDPSRSKPLQDVIDEVEKKSRSHNWHHGSPLFCFRCGSRSHTKERAAKGGPCRAKVQCEHCKDVRPDSQFGHRSEACVMKAFETSNSSRPNPKRHRKRGSTISSAVQSAHRTTTSTEPESTRETQDISSEIKTDMATLSIDNSPKVPSEVRARTTPAPANSWATIAARTPSAKTSDVQASEGMPKSRFTALRTRKSSSAPDASRHAPTKDHQ